MTEPRGTPIAKSVIIQTTEDNKHVGLIFETSAEPVSIAIPSQNLGATIERLLKTLTILAETQAAIPPQQIQAQPVPVQSLGFAPHPEDSTSALLSVSLAGTQIAFQVDNTMLLQTAQDIVAAAQVVKKPTSH